MTKLISKKSLSLEAAKSLIDFAILKATELGVAGTIAVVDDGGHLICLERIDGTMAAAATIAIGKAATAAIFKRPGIILEQTVTTDRPAMRTLIGVTPFSYVPLKGSYPIEVEGEVVGAIGVAGAVNGNNDEIIALLTIEKFNDLLINLPLYK